MGSSEGRAVDSDGYIFSPHGLAELERFARSKVLVAFDFDGTLAPIVDDPAEAQLLPETRRLFTLVCQCYPSIVLSGRSREDLRPRLAGTGVAEIIGNHGAETDEPGTSPDPRIAQWKTLLEHRLAGMEGVWIEDKTLSLAVHYRQHPDIRQARKLVWSVASDLDGARLVSAILALNIVPASAPHKGTALDVSRRRRGCNTAIFVGDDTTDEDVFQLDSAFLLGIRVGRSSLSHARYWLRNQLEVDALLRELLRVT